MPYKDPKLQKMYFAAYSAKRRKSGQSAEESLRYQQNNRALIRARAAERRALTVKNMPAWADRIAILDMYELAQTAGAMLGEECNVDHIVPVKSDFVCGLHCEDNLRVLTSRKNKKKGNRHWPSMSDTSDPELLALTKRFKNETVNNNLTQDKPERTSVSEKAPPLDMKPNLQTTLLQQPDIIAQYVKGELSVADIATALGYKESYVTVTLSTMKIKREPNPNSIYAQRARKKRLLKARRSYRASLVEQVKHHGLLIKDAAEQAGCSVRTMYRLVNDK